MSKSRKLKSWDASLKEVDQEAAIRVFGEVESGPIKGRGAQHNTPNSFDRWRTDQFYPEGIDAVEQEQPKTLFVEQFAKTLVNKVESPDVHLNWSMNPYQGCEHGCIYCYARNSHEYWGMSAGLDFESKIIVKKNAPELLRKFLLKKSWKPEPISLSGNTDCYQPGEQRFQLTKRLLEICLDFKQPVTLITKNAGILRDVDLLAKLAAQNLTSVMVSITSLEEPLRLKMEPRTTTAGQRLRLIKTLTDAGVPCGVMMGPIIPGLTDHEMFDILSAAKEAGAQYAGFTMIRLNGAVQVLFREWLHLHFPDKVDKVWHLIEEVHGGAVSDSRFGTRMKGEGKFADIIHQQFKQFKQKLGFLETYKPLDTTLFRPPGQQISLFDGLL